METLSRPKSILLLAGLLFVASLQTTQAQTGLQFNGTNQYVTFGTATALGTANFTIECWFKRTGTGVATSTGTGGVTNAIPLLTKGRGEGESPANLNMNYFLGIDNGTTRLCADFEEGSGPNHPIIGTTTIALNTWYHAAVTYDVATATIRLYLNGVQENSIALAAGITPASTSIQHAAIGTGLTSTGTAAGYFAGVIDEARIWNYARSQQNISDSVNVEITSTVSGLLGRWGLNEGSGSTANNTVAGNPNGTLTNTPTWVSGNPSFPVPLPAAPSGLGVSAISFGQIHLTWTDNANNESNFEIERSTTGLGGPYSPVSTVSSNTVAYDDLNLNGSLEYCYRVRATNSGGASDFLTPQCTTTPPEGSGGLQFPGTNSYVTFGQATALGVQSFTLECWFKRTGAGTTTTSGTDGILAVPLVTKGMAEADATAADMNFFLGINGPTSVAGRSYGPPNVLSADFEEGTGTSTPGLNHPVAGVTPIVNDIWYHAAVTFDATNRRWQLFLNGNLEKDTVLASGSRFPQFNSTQHAAIGSALQSSGSPGSSAGYGPGYFNGTIDEVRIWNFARTQGDIRSTINSQITASQLGLMARWGMNEGTGSFVNGGAGSITAGSIMGTGSTWSTPGAPFNIAFNQSPDLPVLVAPMNMASGVPLSPTLDIIATDPDADNLTVTFYGRPVVAAPGADFTVIALPDAQYYTSETNGGSNAILKQQTQWVVNNRGAENIAFVSQLGDLSENGDTYIVQWQRADTALKILENAIPEIPYGIAIGNHDQTGGTTYYNQFFGFTRFSGHPYYGDHYGTNNNNYFELFSASALNFVVINLEYGASAGAIHWADSILKAYPSRNGILVNHSLLANATNPASFSASGLAIYDSLKDNQNLTLMLCGHVDGEGQRADTYDGRTVYSLLSDYQGRTNGGNGWMRIMEFSPANNEIRVRTYSPTLNQFETDANSQFTIPYQMSVTSNFVVIGSVSVPSGSHATVQWPALSSDTEYEWYATVSDGNSSVTGPTWSFTTIEGSATIVTSSANPSTTGQSVTFTATVSPSSATGTIQFRIDDIDFGSPTTLSGGVATSNSTSTLTAGIHQVVALYSGDATHTGSMSPVFAQTVTSPVQYTLAANVIGSGSITLSPPGGIYAESTIVTITAVPTAGWTFSSWSGDLTGTTNPNTIIMNTNKAVVASFADQNLIGHWKFDETSGTVAQDASGHGLTGTVSGATWTTGRIDGALQFDGTNDYVDIGNPPLLQSTGSMTWCAWVRATANPPDDGQIIAKSGNVDGWQLKTSPDTGPHTFCVAVSNGSAHTSRFSTTARSLNTWYHVAGVYNAQARTLNIYVNGVLDNGTLNGTVPASQNSPNLNVNIGRRSGGYYFDGLIDEVRAYSRVLTQEEIQAVMTPGPTMYTLAVNTVGNGGVTLNPAGGLYSSGTVVTLTATPSTGWNFGGWSGALSGNTNPTTITMDANKSITATFVSGEGYTLTVSTVGNGSVALNPPGGTYDGGTVVTLTATPASGWSFGGWSGALTGSTNPTTITMDANKSVTATFVGGQPAAHWKFDEASGSTAQDASGNGLDGTVNGATWTSGRINGALQFNGTNSYVEIGNPSLLQTTGSMSWCAWVRASADPDDDGQIIAKSNDNAGWQLKTSQDTGPQRFAVAISADANSHTQRNSAMTRSLNTWYHVAGVYNAGAQTLDLYVNGILDNGVLSGTVPSSQYVPSVNVNVGRRPAGYYFNGIIDEARIYNRALTQQEIQALMTSGPSQYALTVSAIGSGLVSRSPSFAQYDSGQVVILTATPASGYAFAGWSGNLTGITNPASITMNADKSVTATFALQPASGSVAFAAIGDYGTGGTDAATVVSLIKNLNPSLIITTGDNNYTGNGTTAGWDNVVGKFYGQQFVHYPAGSTSSHVPGPTDNAFFPSIGNHDMDLGLANSQPNYFDLPPNERYYTFVRGPVQFFALDADPREPDGTSSTSTQAQWLQTELAASTAPWKVVFLHQPPYTSGTTHGPTTYMQWPFEQWGVDAVIGGHEHNMERIIRDGNGDGRNIAYLISGAGGQSLYPFGTPIAGSQFRSYAAYGTLFVEATTTSMTFEFYSIANPGSPIDTYTLLKQTSGGDHTEDFNTFAIDQPVGNHAGWFDGSPSSGPVVRAGNGVPNSSGQPTQGIDGSATICTWTEYPFIWSDGALEAVVLGMDFRSDGNGQFDDDRACWNINQSTDSRYNFGVQLDNASGVYAVTTYWRGSITNDDPRIQDPIVSLSGILPDTWYRLRATITKLTAGSARIDVSVVQLDAFGNPTGTPITGSVPNTSTWSGGAPDPGYFTAGAMWPAYKNHTGAAAPADNAFAQFVTGTPVQYTLTVNTVGNGNVTLSPPGGTYNSGTIVTLTAVPTTDWSFSGWSGDLTGAMNPATITMNADKSITGTFTQTPPGSGWIAFNDCVFDPSNEGVATDPNGNLVHYRGTNTTTFGIGSGYTGPTSGQLIKRSDGSGTGVTVTLTQSGGVTWQADVSSSWNGGYDPNPGTDAYTTFHGIADMTGVIYYGTGTGWYVDLTFTGLDPSKQYIFATSSARCNAAYTNRRTIYTLTGADEYTNASTSGVVELAANRVMFNTGDNRTLGYVARWLNIKSASGTFTIRAEADPTDDDGYRAYSFDVFMLQQTGGPPPSDMIWSADISVSEGISSQMLSFGQAANATDGLDVDLGEEPLPPLPPAGVFDARFNLPVLPAVGSARDYRDSAALSPEWSIAFQRVSASEPVTFSWDRTVLQNAGGLFALMDNAGGSLVNINMRGQSTYVLTNPAITSLIVKHTRTSMLCSDVATDSGWNMLSVPLLASDMHTAAVFPGATSQAYGFDGGYVPASVLELGRGYWLELNEAGTYTICGATPTSNDIPVNVEWNMIAPLDNDIPAVAVTSTPPDIMVSPFYGFNNGYTVASTLVHGKGYWVMASGAGILHLNGGTAKGVTNTSLVDPTWPRVTFTNPQGQERELHFALTPQLSENYTLPPVPPSGVFDVRFSSNMSVEIFGEGAHEVDLSSASYPIVLRASNLTNKRFHVQDMINGKLLNEDLAEDKPVVITQRLNRIILTESSLGNVPREFALAQNYPNPFNPATTIRFALPSPTRVKINVFDVLGAKVANIVDADYEAGYHNIVFNARDFASGVYFYQIAAGQFTAVKKLMILK